MKLTNKQLRQIIKEELEAVMSEAPSNDYIIKFSKGEVMIQDDQGVFAKYLEIQPEYDILFNVARTNKRDPEMFEKLAMLIEKLRPAVSRPQPADVRFDGLENVFKSGKAF